MAAQTLSSVLGRMSDLAVDATDHAFLGMIYGPYGTGKSTLASGLAQTLINPELGERILFVDSAAGYVSLDNIPSLKENMTRVAFNSYGDLPVLADAIKRKAKQGGIDFGKFKVVIIDEIDTVADSTLDTYLRDKHSTLPAEQTPEAEGRDYKPMGDLVRQAIVNFQRIGVHVILVAHDKDRKDHRDVIVTGPSLSPQLKKGVINLMHVVAHCTGANVGTAAKLRYERFVQSKPTNLIEAKTRIGTLNEVTKMSHEDWVFAIADWVSPGGTMISDLQSPEVQTEELEEDELPTEGIPVSDSPDEDAPAFSESAE